MNDLPIDFLDFLIFFFATLPMNNKEDNDVIVLLSIMFYLINVSQDTCLDWGNY